MVVEVLGRVDCQPEQSRNALQTDRSCTDLAQANEWCSQDRKMSILGG